MTMGRGAEWTGSWFGAGRVRGLALALASAGAISLIVTSFIRRPKATEPLAARSATFPEDAAASVQTIPTID